MGLHKFTVLNVRNIANAHVQPESGFNLIVGANGSGKSSLLEAIHILGRAHSFRSHNSKKVISFAAPQLTVSGLVSDDTDGLVPMGVQIDAKATTLRLNRQTVTSRAQMAYALPLQVLHPKSYLLLDGSPSYRREFVDWGAFHAAPNFLDAWRRYRKALAQRNSMLKQRQLRSLDTWNYELVEYGKMVASFRQSYVNCLFQAFLGIGPRLLDVPDIVLEIYDGWDQRNDFADVLQKDLEKDLRYGFTNAGPHRADLHVTAHGHLVHEVLSRGQLKLLVLALKMAQLTVLDLQYRQRCSVLVDDLASEIDPDNMCKVFDFLAQQGLQVFMTATHSGQFEGLLQNHPCKLFHMEHGQVKEQ